MSSSRLRPRAAGIAAALLVAALALGAPTVATAIPPTADPQFVQVAASRYSPYISSDTPYGFVIGLTATGDLYSWGSSSSGALGLGEATLATNTPTRIDLSAVVPAGDRVIQISAGATSVLALTEQGRVLAWGDNDSGQLGLGDDDSRYAPTLVPASSFPGLGSDKKIISIAAGASDWALALSDSSSAESGAVYGWGDNSLGQLGPVGAGPWSSPIQVAPSQLGANIKLIAAGSASGYAVDSAGQLYSWGNNLYGQLNRGNYSSQSTPTIRTGGYGSEKIVKIAAGGEHVIAVTENDQVYTWGDNSEGQLGNNSIAGQPTAVNITARLLSIPGGGRLAAVSAGALHSAALTTTGNVIVWGDNSYGQLGRGNTTTSYVPRQVFTFPAIVDGAPISSIVAGDYSTFVTTTTGGVYGTGVQGAFGDASNGEYDPGWGMTFFPEALSFTPIRLADLSGNVTVAPEHPTEGAEITATPSGFGDGAMFDYQWLRDGGDIADANTSSYTVTAADIGHELTVRVRVRAENRGEAFATSDPVVPGTAPEITTAALPQTAPGILYRQTVAALGSAPIAFGSADLPAWLTLNTASGELEGIAPEQVGEASFTVTATNAFGESSRSFTVTVVPGDPDHLVLTPSSTAASQGGAVEFTATAYDSFDNLIGDVTADTEFTSDVPSDAITGNTVTFSQAGSRTITGTSGGNVIGSVRIEVAPETGGSDDDDEGNATEPRGDRDPRQLGDTGAASLAKFGGLGALALALGALSVLLGRRARRP